MYNISFFRRFFITKSSYFSLSLLSVKPKDKVVLFPGALRLSLSANWSGRADIKYRAIVTFMVLFTGEFT